MAACVPVTNTSPSTTEGSKINRQSKAEQKQEGARVHTELAQQYMANGDLEDALAKVNKARDLIQLGAYAPGHDADLDTAVRLQPALIALLQQDMHEPATLAASRQQQRQVTQQ